MVLILFIGMWRPTHCGWRHSLWGSFWTAEKSRHELITSTCENSLLSDPDNECNVIRFSTFLLIDFPNKVAPGNVLKDTICLSLFNHHLIFALYSFLFIILSYIASWMQFLLPPLLPGPHTYLPSPPDPLILLSLVFVSGCFWKGVFS